MDLFTDGAYWPFALASYALCALAFLQVFFLVLGADIFGFVDDVLPDFDLDSESGFDKALNFVGLGKVPTMVVVMAYMMAFIIVGYIIQKAASALIGEALAVSLATGVAGFIAFFATGTIARQVGRILPSEETYAVTSDSLIGRVASITSGEATYHLPASAIVRDVHDKRHDIYVKASSPEEAFFVGSEVSIISKNEGFYIVTSSPSLPKSPFKGAK